MTGYTGLWRWPSFKPEEVLSPEGIREFEQRQVLLVQPVLLDKLEAFKKYVNLPLHINHGKLLYRGYRSPHENYKIVKGETYSYHMQGLAADVTCYDLKIEEFRDEAIAFGFMGVGFYPMQNFCHLDLRARLDNNPAIWTKL